MLEIEVCEIRGKCPVHRVGDKIVIKGPHIVLDGTDALCIHALPVILHYAVALEEGADPVKLGLTKPEDRRHTYLQCVDPGKPYTEGGTVIFKIRVRQSEALKTVEEASKICGKRRVKADSAELIREDRERR